MKFEALKMVNENNEKAKKVKSILRKYYSVEAYTLDRNKRILELETKDRNVIKVKFKKITNKNKFKIVNYEIKEE